MHHSYQFNAGTIRKGTISTLNIPQNPLDLTSCIPDARSAELEPSEPKVKPRC